MAVQLRKKDLLERWGWRAASTPARRVKQGLLTPPVVECSIPYWPLREIETIERARLAGADDDGVRKVVKDLMAARSNQVAGLQEPLATAA